MTVSSGDPGDEHVERPSTQTDRIVERLRFHVNPTSMRYHGSPVYLVGGALRDDDPRDVDIVIVMPDELFYRAYIYPDHHLDWMVKNWKYQGLGADPPRWWKRWARDCTKQARWLTVAIGGPIVDFKTQFATEAAAYTGPRVLLSTPYIKAST